MTSGTSVPQPIRLDGFKYDPSPMSIRKSAEATVEMAVALNLCALMEVHITWVLAKLLGPKATKTGLAMYRSIESDNARNAVLRGAAKAVLSKRDFDLFTVLLGFVGTARTGRNKIAHNLWAFSDQMPDSLIMRDAREQSETVSYSARMHSNPNLYRDLDRELAKWPKTSVSRWTADDFRNITNDARRALNSLTAFWWPAERSRTESSTRLERQKLRRQPEIHEALRRLSEERRKAREAAKQLRLRRQQARRPKKT